jgi:hypothetical protein
MTEMGGVGVAQCKTCHFCIEILHKVSYCRNVTSDHYGHVIMDFHPICKDFTRKIYGAKKWNLKTE